MSAHFTLLKTKYNISARAVLRDNEFCFEGDEEVSPKWIIILSDDLIENELMFTLITSQTETYTGSLNKYIEVNKVDEICFQRDCIIEIERTHPIKPDILLDKFDRGAVEHKGFVSPELLQRIFEEIAECETIYEYVKDGLGVYD